MSVNKTILAIILLSGASFSDFAATEVNSSIDRTVIGTVSDSSGAINLSDLNANLAAKADKAGASSYRVISAGGNNIQFGTAEIYK